MNTNAITNLENDSVMTNEAEKPMFFLNINNESHSTYNYINLNSITHVSEKPSAITDNIDSDRILPNKSSNFKIESMTSNDLQIPKSPKGTLTNRIKNKVIEANNNLDMSKNPLSLDSNLEVEILDKKNIHNATKFNCNESTIRGSLGYNIAEGSVDGKYIY